MYSCTSKASKLMCLRECPACDRSARQLMYSCTIQASKLKYLLECPVCDHSEHAECRLAQLLLLSASSLLL